MMFTEVPFIERFAAARKPGSMLWSFCFPMTTPPSKSAATGAKPSDTGAVQYRSRRYNAGEWGLSALPGREHEARAASTWHWNMHWRSIVNKSM